MTSNCVKLLVLAIIALSFTSYANPLHDFASKGDSDGLAEYIRDGKPLLEEFVQVDSNEETPLDIAMRTKNFGIIEALTRTQIFLSTVRGFRGGGLVHPVHAYVERGDAWGFILYLTYFQVTYVELMNDRHGRNIFEIAREAGNPEMMNLVRDSMQNTAETALTPLREIRGGDNTYAANPQAGAGGKDKEEDDSSAATLTLDSDDEHSNDENSDSHLFGSGGNRLFFDLEEGDDASLRASFSGFLSPRSN